MDRQTRNKSKERFDKTQHAKEEMKVVEQVLIKQAKIRIKPPYNPKSYTIQFDFLHDLWWRNFNPEPILQSLDHGIPGLK